MSFKTRRQIIDLALSNLGVLAAGQTAEVEDVARVDIFVNAAVADLRIRDIYDVPDPEEIDDAIASDFGVILANTCRHAFGLSGNPELQAAALAAEQSLRVKSAQGPTYEPLRSTYF